MDKKEAEKLMNILKENWEDYIYYDVDENHSERIMYMQSNGLFYVKEDGAIKNFYHITEEEVIERIMKYKK